MAGCQKAVHQSWPPIAEHNRTQKIQISKYAKNVQKKISD